MRVEELPVRNHYIVAVAGSSVTAFSTLTVGTLVRSVLYEDDPRDAITLMPIGLVIAVVGETATIVWS